MSYLLVDDDPADLELLKVAFRAVAPEREVVAFNDSQKAILWVDEQLAAEDLSSFILVTDLKMPILDGAQLVAAVRERCVAGPVTIVLSTSQRQADIDRVYAAGAHAYHSKPMGYHGTVELCRAIDQYWASAERPSGIPLD